MSRPQLPKMVAAVFSWRKVRMVERLPLPCAANEKHPANRSQQSIFPVILSACGRGNPQAGRFLHTERLIFAPRSMIYPTPVMNIMSSSEETSAFPS